MKRQKDIELGYNLYNAPARPATSPSKKRSSKNSAQQKGGGRLGSSTPPPSSAGREEATAKISKLKLSSKQLPPISVVVAERNYLEERLVYAAKADTSNLSPDTVDVLEAVSTSITQRTAATRGVLALKKKLLPVSEELARALVAACNCSKLEESLTTLRACREKLVERSAAVVLVDEAIVSLQHYLHPQAQIPQAELARLDAAVEQGHPGAMLLVSFLLRDGICVPRSVGAALEWTRRAAELQYVPAMHELGDSYEKGVSAGEGEGSVLEADWGEAVVWYTRAAAAGFAASQLNLGKLWWEAAQEATAGDLVSPKEVKEMMAHTRSWLGEAAKNGNSEAKSLLDRLS